VKAVRVTKLLTDTYNEWATDGAPRFAAALAFYTVFSFTPLLVISIAVASVLFGREAAQEQLAGAFQSFLGPQGSESVHRLMESARDQSGAATIIGILTMVFGATGVFAELQEALNTMWDVSVKPGNAIKIFLRKRLFSFLMVLGIGVLLLASLVLGTATSAVTKYFPDSFPIPGIFIEGAQFVFSLGLATLVFATIYKVLPDVKIAWSDVWAGAAVTAVLFNIGKTLIGIYLVNSTVASPYGAAGSLVLLLVWVYYSAQVFFFGAEFTQVYARWRGRPIGPDRNAIGLSKKCEAVPSPQPGAVTTSPGGNTR
jgi:membrane protein